MNMKKKAYIRPLTATVAVSIYGLAAASPSHDEPIVIPSGDLDDPPEPGKGGYIWGE